MATYDPLTRVYNRWVTASIGVAAYQSMESIDDLVNRADKALYKAKNAGKNRAEFLPPTSS